MDRESYFIRKLTNSSVACGIGDDGVVFSKNPLNLHRGREVCIFNDIKSPVYAMDLFWEGVHFKREWLSATQIAKKAFLVNISDILAMNATPKYALLGISLPKNISKSFIDDFISGIVQICEEFKIQVVGGDTICGKDLGVAITMIGEICTRGLFRVGAKIGDLIIHTGKIGGSYAELKRLLRSDQVSNKKSRFYEPTLRTKFIYAMSRFAHLGIDISDGINNELNRLSILNNLCFKLKNPYEKSYQSGEEYEMLFCISPKDYLHAQKLAHLHRVDLACIGRVVRGKNSYRARSWH